jgi:hypothetical protein
MRNRIICAAQKAISTASPVKHALTLARVKHRVVIACGAQIGAAPQFSSAMSV